MNDFMLGELNLALNNIKRNKILSCINNDICINIFCQNEDTAYYLIHSAVALQSVALVKKMLNISVNVVSQGIKDNILYEDLNNYNDNESFKIYNEVNFSFDKEKENVTFFVVDYNNDNIPEETLSLLKKALEFSQQVGGKFVLLENLPIINDVQSEYILAENELTALYENSKTDVSKFVLAMEKEALANDSTVILRSYNLYGSKINNKNSFISIASEIVTHPEICISSAEAQKNISFTSISDFVTAAYYVSFCEINKSIFNVISLNMTVLRVFTDLIGLLGNKNLNFNVSNNNKNFLPNYISISGRTLYGQMFKKSISYSLELQMALCSLNNLEYTDMKLYKKYDGKLELIKKIELEMIRDIDQICKKYDIKYFLVGGSLLGAVRHNGFIPWDDDLDIGMLRDDYEKFRKYFPKEISEKYNYQSYLNDDGSHYIFDKLRLKDTVFSTKFSNQFPIENGLFIDVLVYDKTSNSEKAQKRHIRQLTIWKRVINVRWVNKPRRKIHYYKTKMLLPIMRLIPFRVYHNIYEKMLKKYYKKDTQYLIDGVGMNLHRGAFPSEWFDKIIEIDFEGMKLPVPAKYDEYLRHWYGENYMSLLPIPSRTSGHSMNTIDIGKYINIK